MTPDVGRTDDCCDDEEGSLDVAHTMESSGEDTEDEE